MHRAKKVIQLYFSFSKKELNGIFILFLLMFTILVIPLLYPYFVQDEGNDFETFRNEAEQFRALTIKRRHQQKEFRSNEHDRALETEYFKFDPNKLNNEQWKRLGLSDKQIGVIRNYVSRGGRFYRNEDLKKIYSISPDLYKALEPYIRIAENTSFKRSGGIASSNQLQVDRQLTPKSLIELNLADSVKLESIRGIGPVFASRIIRFRNRLGGFYSREQLREVYGMDSVKFNMIRDEVNADAGLIQKIDLNKVTFDEIRRHPYLSYKQINAIIQFRSQHGPFHSIDDLKKVAILNEEIIRKIEPYFVFRP